MGARFAGRDILVEALRQQQGYTIDKATKAVNDFIGILKKELRKRKSIDLEGIGRIYAIKRPNAKVRYKELNLKHVGPTIVTRFKKKYEIRFKRAAHWDKEEDE